MLAPSSNAGSLGQQLLVCKSQTISRPSHNCGKKGPINSCTSCFAPNKPLLIKGTSIWACKAVYLTGTVKRKSLSANTKSHRVISLQALNFSRYYSKYSTNSVLTNGVSGTRNSAPQISLPGIPHSQVVNVPREEEEAFRTVQSIHEAAVVACIRTDSASLALAAARSALDGGISVLELTLTTPSATEVIGALVREYPDATIGAGTVVTLEGAQEAVEAGARFLMSPATDQDLVQRYSGGPSVFIPGAMTPTEVLTATKLGARMVKVFPIGSAGGEGFVRAMQRAMPGVLLVPAHQITLEMVGPYIAAGASAVVLSDAIFQRQAMAARDFATIQHLASSAVLLGRKARATSQQSG